MALLYADAVPLIPAEHMGLTAAAHGLGTCIVGWLDIKRAGEILNLPQSAACLYIMPVDYPAHEPAPRRLKSMDEISFYETFGKRD